MNILCLKANPDSIIRSLYFLLHSLGKYKKKPEPGDVDIGIVINIDKD
jgi:hypothetical protein